MQQTQHRLIKPLHRHRQVRPRQDLQVPLMLVEFVLMRDGLVLFLYKNSVSDLMAH